MSGSMLDIALRAAAEECDQLKGQLEEAVAVLKLVEWLNAKEPRAMRWCYVCGAVQSSGHAPDCRLKKVIA